MDLLQSLSGQKSPGAGNTSPVRDDTIAKEFNKVFTEKRRGNNERPTLITSEILKSTRVDIAESRLHLEVIPTLP